MAETTAVTGRSPAYRAIRSQAAFIRSAEPTLVPPNFMTSRFSKTSYTPSLRFAVRYLCANNAEDRVFHLFRRHSRGIQVDGVRGLQKRRLSPVTIPVVAFDSGIGDLLRRAGDPASAIPLLDPRAMADRVALLLGDPALRSTVGGRLTTEVRRRHVTGAAAPGLLEVLHEVVPR